MAFTLAIVLASMILVNTALGITGPLLLSPYLEKNNGQLARDLSRVQSHDIPDSHAGFITVNKTLGNHLFFWFFPLPASQDASAPLLLWLNGGPGVSSMLGLFWENGPLEVVPGKGQSTPTLKGRKTSWANHYSIVYVDNPVGVGFSYSDSGQDGFRTTQDGYGDDLHSFVKQFFEMFPEYRSRGFYIGGQFYAGKYVPVLGMRLHEDLQKGIVDVPLTGIILGSPFFDPANMMEPFYESLYSLGIISHATKTKYQNRASMLYNDFLGGHTSNLTFNDIVSQLVPTKLPSRFLENFVTAEKLDFKSLGDLLNSQRMRSLINVGNTPFQIKNKFDTMLHIGHEFFSSTAGKLATLMNNYKVLIYSEDYNLQVSSRMVDEALMRLSSWQDVGYFRVSQRVWWKKGRDLQGFYNRVSRKVCRVVIHGAGQHASRDQPETALRMIKDFVDYGCIYIRDID